MNLELNTNSVEQATPAPTPACEAAIIPKTDTRLRSLDALRGFDMFWIVGGDMLLHKLSRSYDWPWLKWLGKEMSHVQWEGFHFYDLIFPLFLFLAGVAIPYSIGKKLEAGTEKGKLLLSVLKRVALLVILGIVYNGGFAFRPLSETRICSVLGLIGIAYGIAATLFIYAKPKYRTCTMIAWVIGILLGYWAALSWIYVPDVGRGILTANGNLAGYIDRELLPWHLNNTIYDPEGFIPSIVAASVALTGALTGDFLRNSDTSKHRKGLVMLTVGLLLLGITYIWGIYLPFIKKMWTPSYMLHCTGWSLIFLSLFYFIIDVFGFWRWSFFFIVIGMNPILIYLASRIIPIENISNFIFGGLISKFSTPTHAWLGVICYIITWWLALLYFYRKKCFLRV